MDTLSSVLSMLKPQTFVAAGLNAGGKWAIQFPAHGGIKFNAVIKGQCQLQVEGDEQIYSLQAGDCFLLTSGRRFMLANDLTIPKIPSETIYENAVNNTALCNDGGDFFLIGARFHFEAEHTRFLFGQLPPVVHVPEDRDQATVLRWGLERFNIEFLNNMPGRNIMMEYLAPMMLIQTLRVYLSTSPNKLHGWMAALSMPQIRQALEAIHTQPAHKWTVAELGTIAGMSRSGFALKFKEVIGLSPMDYLTQWRILIAREALKSGTKSLYEIAVSLGYDAESSFAAVFKRFVGCSPKSYMKKFR
ncbi:AraC-type DNA-binding protein [Chitinophaga costaii]|uniref:AraC-type DNA-binding protein n=1 Tax=Chitinophaga costaii TaxID=1335309 RepID=A0A1C4BB67_9BACT|nr:AraC family transcriptional regulator [Chitinophaga costaii]PUZ27679.1 AraC family transcriptional regulator [Chitinophaga costaii]SCC04125.1 AraC-type DNA-binding protein [Chitinophaga costaii]